LESRVIPEDLQARLHLLTTSRALSIILQNAFRHSPNGGKITLSAERHNNKVILAVTDEGDGIDKLHLEKIFEPGFTTAGSTGLGLWFARELVLLLNGTISVESEAGKGATFKISLPIIDENEHYAGQGENPGGG
jgi:signal transduction histidine kinase